VDHIDALEALEPPREPVGNDLHVDVVEIRGDHENKIGTLLEECGRGEPVPRRLRESVAQVHRLRERASRKAPVALFLSLAHSEV